MEESAVHGSAIQHSQSAAKREREDGFAAEFSADLPEARSDFVESLVPSDALPFLRKTGPRVPPTLRSHSSQRIQNPVGRIHAIQVLSHLGAQETTRGRMRRITLNFGRAAVLNGNQNSASIWAIVRTGSVNDLLHGF